MKLTTLMLSDLLVDRPGAEPGLAACKAAVLPLSLSAQKERAAAKQTNEENKQKAAALSEYNYNIFLHT